MARDLRGEFSVSYCRDVGVVKHVSKPPQSNKPCAYASGRRNWDFFALYGLP
jgi:hypothetical protein